MQIDKVQGMGTLALKLSGRLDTNTATVLEAELGASLDGVQELTFNMAQLQYISSAGLRVLLAAQKRMNRQGRMLLTNVGESVMEIFEVTGFADILTIE
jgi:anti-sigma B factor antagonist